MATPRSRYLSTAWADGIFNDRVVFVTGGAGDICSAQTKALVHLGANACIVGRNVEKTERVAQEIALVRKGARVLGIGQVDVRNFENLQKAVDRCVRELGAIDFVIAGAAGNFVAPLAGLSPNAFKAVLEIDTVGTFHTIKATVPHLVASAARNANPNSAGTTGGRILAISATFQYTGVPLQTHLSAAKSAVDSLMVSVALEYGPRGVVANVLAPGAIADTEGFSRLGDGPSKSELDKGQRGVPSGRWGTVRDIADATVFLFSDAANYVNGTTLVVDGAGWRRQAALAVGHSPGMIKYPDFLLDGDEATDTSASRTKPREKAKM